MVARHIVIDMQRLFAEDTAWHTAAMADIIGNVKRLSTELADITLYAKFLTPASADKAEGRWRIYYQRWAAVTTDALDASFHDLMPELADMARPEKMVEKFTYSVFGAPGFAEKLKADGVDTLIFSGVETDICVLASLFDAIDAGFHVVVAVDAVASSDMASHQAVLTHVLPRMSDQIDLKTVADVLEQFG